MEKQLSTQTRVANSENVSFLYVIEINVRLTCNTITPAFEVKVQCMFSVQ